MLYLRLSCRRPAPLATNSDGSLSFALPPSRITSNDLNPFMESGSARRWFEPKNKFRRFDNPPIEAGSVSRRLRPALRFSRALNPPIH
jgi:hypothetical protein